MESNLIASINNSVSADMIRGGQDLQLKNRQCAETGKNMCIPNWRQQLSFLANRSVLEFFSCRNLITACVGVLIRISVFYFSD